MVRVALGVSMLAACASSVLAQPSDAYVDQVDRSPQGAVSMPNSPGMQGSVYVIQVPEGARPVARPVERRVPVRRSAPASQASAAAVEPAVPQAIFPSVGSGVILALSQTTATRVFPDVGAGVGAP